MLTDDSPASDTRRRGGRVRRDRSLRLRLGHAFLGFRAGAAWTPSVEFHDVRFLQRVAIVTELRWIRRSSRLVAAVLPCPLRVFADKELSAALEWLRTPNTSRVCARMVGDSGVCVVEPHAPLTVQDIDAVADAVAPWELLGALRGLVFRMPGFRGWQNLGALLRHAQFVQNHRGRVRRVAVATDGGRVGLLLGTMGDLMKASVRTFRYGELAEAIAWASGTPPCAF